MKSAHSFEHEKDGRRRHHSDSADSEDERRRMRRRKEREAEEDKYSSRRKENTRSGSMRDNYDDRESKRQRTRSPRSPRGQDRDRDSKHRSRRDRSPDRRSRDKDLSSTQVSRKNKGPLPSQEASFQLNKDPSMTLVPGGDKEVPEKQQPNFAPTGLLAAASNSVTQADGTAIILKYHEPAEARKPPPKDDWKLFVFKGSDIIDTIELSTRSCWLIGRELAVVDMSAEHPSISKQHAVIQFRYIEKRNEFGDKLGRVRPYLIDLDSANGTLLNKDGVPPSRYLELRDKDMIQFGHSNFPPVYTVPPADVRQADSVTGVIVKREANRAESLDHDNKHGEFLIRAALHRMGSAINLDEIKRFEVTEVYAHPDAKVDIVLVHGLNGDPRLSWTAKNGVFWPTQLLPVSLKSVKARILVYGYNADVYAFGGRSASSDMIHMHAQSLISNLALERKSEEVADHPIIWVAHSLGGILVKRALELSNDIQSKNADDERSIFVSTYGIIFLGTPHTGAEPAKWGHIIQGMVDAMVPKKIMETESVLIKTLKTDNETLQNINIHFLDIYQKFKICMAHEAVKTDLRGTKAYVVDQASASPLLPDVQYFGIEATHSGMAKFESKNSPGYLNVSTTIKSWVVEAPQVIQARWDMERRLRRQIRESEARELLKNYSVNPTEVPGGSTSTHDLSNSAIMSTSAIHSVASIEPDNHSDDDAPYFIKPLGFRPNSLFVGRGAELVELHKLLFDEKKRCEGTSAVLIQSMPGGGKTHLARQYVYEHRQDYPGGIFWLRAKSQTELAAGFWDIARKIALSPSMVNEDSKSLEDPQQFINMVRKWLNHRHDWLMVLDGIHFDNAEALQKFIPDSKNTSLIYTSTEKAITGDYHFMNPQLIRLPHLSAREAQRLMLLELGKREPFLTDDLKHSMELVLAMEFLPVVIHAVAQRIKTTEEPLARFAKSYSSEARLRGLGAYISVVEQLKILGAFETLNLMYILCFLSQHIPVEMIVLGLNALEVPCSTLFALIDRNEHEESLHSSQSSKGSRDMLPENVDVIRLHSVVQGFFVDTLLAGGTLPLWLDRAVRVFCCSYDAANDRISRKTNTGLVEDYRLYEIHGNKLMDFVSRHKKKTPLLEETRALLESRLEAIKREIERRTPESSRAMAGVRSETFQTSIFDRTSSSSDTGPETPGFADKYSKISTWGMEDNKVETESPLSLTHDANFARHNQFPPLPPPEDAGYESDREGSTAMTLKLSQRTIQGREDSVDSFGGPWEIVKTRRSKVRPSRLDLHRTIKTMENKRYRDSAGAFRAVHATDPRVTHETAKGFLLQGNTPATQRRGRISGQSGAEVALTHITKTSPPPQRMGPIQDKRTSSQKPSEKRSLKLGTPSYAAAVSKPTKNTASGYRDPTTFDLRESSSDSSASLNNQPQVSAIASLQKIPNGITRQPPTYTPTAPPYPPSPFLSDQHYASANTPIYQIPGRYSQENLLGTDPYPTTVYPRMTGPLLVERTQSQYSLPSAVRKRDLPHDYQAWDSQTYSESSPSVIDQPPQFLSLSTGNLQRPGLYYPGRPELTSSNDGYTSQPMSRDPSGQSTHSASAQGAEETRRRPSVAATEPLPQLPIFSPRIPPTSYQVYENLRERERRDRGMVRKSPRLAFARAALIDRLDDWNEENNPFQPRRGFNPAAPSFTPSPSYYSANLPPAPANSIISNQSPRQPATPKSTPESYQAPDMGRTLSGGLKVGKRLIEFGDIGDPIDYEIARERTERLWLERERAREMRAMYRADEVSNQLLPLEIVSSLPPMLMCASTAFGNSLEVTVCKDISWDVMKKLECKYDSDQHLQRDDSSSDLHSENIDMDFTLDILSIDHNTSIPMSTTSEQLEVPHSSSGSLSSSINVPTIDKPNLTDHISRYVGKSPIDWSAIKLRSDVSSSPRPNPYYQEARPVAEKYFALYFTHFHHHWTILHAPKLHNTEPHQLISAAMFMIGAWFNGSQESKELATKIHERITKDLLTQLCRLSSYDNFEQSLEIEVYQAALINIIFGLYRGREPFLSQTIILRNILVGILREVGFFTSGTLMSDDKAGYFMPMQLVKREQRSRLAAYLFKIDSYLNMLRHQPALLTPPELHFQIPSTFSLFNGDGLIEFERRLPKEPAIRSQRSIRQIIQGNDFENTDPNEFPILIEDIQLRICSLQSEIWELSSTMSRKDEQITTAIHRNALKTRLDSCRRQLVSVATPPPPDIEFGQEPILPRRYYFGMEDQSQAGWKELVSTRVCTLIIDTLFLNCLFSIHLHAHIQVLSQVAKEINSPLSQVLAPEVHQRIQEREDEAREWSQTPNMRRCLWNAAEILHLHMKTQNSVSELVKRTLDPVAYMGASVAALIVWMFFELLNGIGEGGMIEKDKEAWIGMGEFCMVSMDGISLCPCGLGILMGKFQKFLPEGWDVADSIAPGIFIGSASDLLKMLWKPTTSYLGTDTTSARTIEDPFNGVDLA
ncbi:hypothetical protein B7494_g1819 [Chlorociboria aeruginascens]|nr:hypothetical protein B7494_g1819 [Chlorociboria aeruginascens]